MLITPLFQRLLLGLALFAAVGILVHDTKIDKAVSLALPVAAITFGVGSHVFDLSGQAHTHVERVSLNQAFSTIPRAQPRDDHRRYYLQKYLSRGSNFFGDSTVYMPAV